MKKTDALTLVIYQYSKCSTCRDSLRFLEEKGIAFEKREITITPPSIEELSRMLHYLKGDVRKLFNTSGMLYKELQLSTKIVNLSKEEAFKLLSNHGMLIKRPFLLGKHFGCVGFRKDHLDKLIKEFYE